MLASDPTDPADRHRRSTGLYRIHVACFLLGLAAFLLALGFGRILIDVVRPWAFVPASLLFIVSGVTAALAGRSLGRHADDPYDLGGDEILSGGIQSLDFGPSGLYFGGPFVLIAFGALGLAGSVFMIL